jgi:hypothetical protein
MDFTPSGWLPVFTQGEAAIKESWAPHRLKPIAASSWLGDEAVQS